MPNNKYKHHQIYFASMSLSKASWIPIVNQNHLFVFYLKQSHKHCRKIFSSPCVEKMIDISKEQLFKDFRAMKMQENPLIT